MSAEIFHFISSYGYLAVFVGSIFEGESIVLLAGALSHEGFLSFPLVFVWACLGAIIGDTFWFFLGRHHGLKYLNRWPWFKKIMGKPMVIVNNHPARLAFLMRFMYGFRHVVPVSLGMSNIPTKTFIFWNFLGSACWSLFFVGIGSIFINIIEESIGNLKRYEIKIAILVIVVVVIISTVGRMFKKIIKEKIEEADQKN